MAKSKVFTITEADAELQSAILKAAAAKNAERAKRTEARSRLHEAVKCLAEAQRALSGPDGDWSEDDWVQSAEHENAAASLLKA